MLRFTLRGIFFISVFSVSKELDLVLSIARLKRGRKFSVCHPLHLLIGHIIRILSEKSRASANMQMLQINKH